MTMIKNGIPYCAGCSRKVKRQELKIGEYFCPIVADTPMKGIVADDTDGCKCVEMDVYVPIDRVNINPKLNENK